MVSNIISDHNLINFSILGKLLEDLLIEVLEVVDGLDECFLGHVESVREGHGCGRVVVEVLEGDRLGQRGLVVDPRTGIAVTTGPDFEVEGTVHSRKEGVRYGWWGTYLSSSVPIRRANLSAI